MSTPFQVERDGPLAIITLNRPDSRNALGLEGDGLAFEAACADIGRDPGVRCTILTGAGSAFSAGGDVKAMRDRTGPFAGSPAAVREGYRANIHRIVRAIYGLDTPVIAAVNGPAVGLGCDVACMADIRIASETARFGVTFLKLGLIPGDGGAWLLPRVIGMSNAAQMLFTGDMIDAETARAWGLVSQVTPAAALMQETRALAHKIAEQPPHALRMAKVLLRQGQSASYEQMMELSAAAQAVMHHTADHEEGVRALLEKRAPQFKGE